MLTPFVRYAKRTGALPNRCFTRACDARFLYILSGKGELCFHSGNKPLEQWDLAYYPPGIAYLPRSSEDNPLEFVTVNFDFDLSHSNMTETLLPVAEELFDETKVIAPRLGSEMAAFSEPMILRGARELADDFLTLDSEMSRIGRYSEEICSATLAKILYRTLLWHETSVISAATRGGIPHAATRALAYIDSHFCGQINNESVAQALGYHPYYLNTAFRRYTGQTMHDYIMKLKINRASELLLSGALTVGEIAQLTGFQSPSHFAVRFKQNTRLTPLEYRRKGGLV